MKKYYGLLKKVGLKYMLVVLAVGGILGLWANWAGAVVSVTTDNLLVNPGAENGTTGWTSDCKTLGAYGYLECEGEKIYPHSGSCLFYFGTVGEYFHAWQWVDISKYITDPALVGTITAKITGVVSTYNDEVTPILYFYESATSSAISG